MAKIWSSKKIWSSNDGPPPARKSKPLPDPLERFEPYLALRSMVLSGKFKPMEEKGLFIHPGDEKKMIDPRTGQPVDFPARVVADRLKRVIREAGLGSDFVVQKYETSTPGVWFVKVRCEPPLAASKKSAS